MKIIFLSPYPNDTVGSQRFRFEQYLSFLRESGFKVSQYSLYSPFIHQLLQRQRSAFTRLLALFVGFFRRIIHLVRVGSSDIVFVHRELFPIGPPFFEWFISKALRKRMIYDFDDAIWLTDNSNESKLESILRNRSKVAKICRCSSTISAGNAYLAEYAKQYNDQVHVIPTTIDMSASDRVPVRSPNKDIITIGWTGTHSTLKYLDDFIPIFRELSQKHQIQLLVIADIDPQYDLKNFKFTRWSRDNEIKDLLTIDIGIMPMPDDPWTRGKCGFKALQFMSLGVPVVVSPVGVNSEIVKNGFNGFAASSKDEWISALNSLIVNSGLRSKIGKEGKKTLNGAYSAESQKQNYRTLFEDLNPE